MRKSITSLCFNIFFSGIKLIVKFSKPGLKYQSKIEMGEGLMAGSTNMITQTDKLSVSSGMQAF